MVYCDRDKGGAKGMRGKDCGLHPKSLMGKKKSPCGRTDGAVEVEDHGNGFMFIGTSDIEQAKRLLEDYVDDVEDYVFAARVLHRYENGRLACSVWLAPEPFALWDGAVGR
jgi:hypothetical protein